VHRLQFNSSVHTGHSPSFSCSACFRRQISFLRWSATGTTLGSVSTQRLMTSRRRGINRVLDLVPDPRLDLLFGHAVEHVNFRVNEGWAARRARVLRRRCAQRSKSSGSCSARSHQTGGRWLRQSLTTSAHCASQRGRAMHSWCRARVATVTTMATHVSIVRRGWLLRSFNWTGSDRC